MATFLELSILLLVFMFFVLAILALFVDAAFGRWVLTDILAIMFCMIMHSIFEPPR